MIESCEYRKFIDLVKLTEQLNSRPLTKEVLIIKAEILCFQDQARNGLKILLEKDFKQEAESLAVKRGRRAMTTLGKVLLHP